MTTMQVEFTETELLADHVYAEPHTGIASERAAYARYLDGFTDGTETR